MPISSKFFRLFCLNFFTFVLLPGKSLYFSGSAIIKPVLSFIKCATMLNGILGLPRCECKFNFTSFWIDYFIFHWSFSNTANLLHIFFSLFLLNIPYVSCRVTLLTFASHLVFLPDSLSGTKFLECFLPFSLIFLYVFFLLLPLEFADISSVNIIHAFCVTDNQIFT